MAIELQATYSKKLGLPNYSSHCYVVSLRTELTDLSQVETESTRLYALLQQSVDKEVQEVGFLPDATTYGMDGGNHPSQPAPVNRLNGHNGKSASPVPTTAPQPKSDEQDTAWNCTDKQRELIRKLGKQAKLQWEDIERIANLRFDQTVRSLDRKQPACSSKLCSLTATRTAAPPAAESAGEPPVSPSACQPKGRTLRSHLVRSSLKAVGK